MDHVLLELHGGIISQTKQTIGRTNLQILRRIGTVLRVHGVLLLGLNLVLLEHNQIINFHHQIIVSLQAIIGNRFLLQKPNPDLLRKLSMTVRRCR